LDSQASKLRSRLRELQKRSAVDVHERVDLRRWTGLRVGGPADLLIRCASDDAVQEVIDLLASHGVPWLVVGAGSRLVPPDAGLRVPLLNLTGELARWEVDLAGCEWGVVVKLPHLEASMAHAGLSGMERLFGIAGSVGGAAHRLIDGHRGAIATLVEWIEQLAPGRPKLRADRREFAIEGSSELESMTRGVVVRVRFRLSAVQPAAIRSRAGAPEGLRSARWVGSAVRVFEDPDAHGVDLLLERARCAGMEIGGARMAERPFNSILTGRRARSEDVIDLCRRVRERVASECDVFLESSLCFVDELGRRYLP
jgi:UDP-N-acetylmuramate dehydrogenase